MIDPTRIWTGENDQYSDRGGPERILHMSEHMPWLLDDGDAFVDLGCGCGGVVQHIQRTGKRACGVTYQHREVEVATSRGIHDVVFGDIHELPYAPAIFDGAICWDVIEHCIAPLAVLKEAHRVLKPSGRLLMFVPGQRWSQSWYHVLVPLPDQLRHLLELAGFTQTTCIDYGSEDLGQAVYKVMK